MATLCFTIIVVVVMAMLAGSPLLLADRAQRRRPGRKRPFAKMQRN